MNNKLIISAIVILIILSVSVFLWFSYNSDVEAISNIKVTLDDIALKDINLTSFKLKLNVNISNPTNQDISSLLSNFDIFIAENYVGKGEFSKVSIPKKSHSNKDIIVTVYYSGLADAVVDIIKNVIINEEFDLTIEGEISGSALFGLSTVSQSFATTKTYN
jgi:hypothetical protein